MNQTTDTVTQVWLALGQLFAGMSGGAVLALVVVAFILGRRRR